MKKRNDTRIQALLPERAQRKECELESGLTKTYGTAPSASGCRNPCGNAMAETFFSILNAEHINRSKPDAFFRSRRDDRPLYPILQSLAYPA